MNMEDMMLNKIIQAEKRKTTLPNLLMKYRRLSLEVRSRGVVEDAGSCQSQGMMLQLHRKNKL